MQIARTASKITHFNESDLAKHYNHETNSALDFFHKVSISVHDGEILKSYITTDLLAWIFLHGI